MTEQRARQLLSSYLNSSCAPGEQEELFEWINHSPDDVVLQQALQDVWSDFTPGATIESIRAEQMLSQILAHENVVLNPAARSGIFWLPLFKAGAAAILIITVGIIGYRSFTTKRPVVKQDIQVAKHQITEPDILPGTTAARLTLDDGSSILLDSIPGSGIAAQGNTQIIRKNGRIIYQKGSTQPPGIMYNTLTTDRGHQYPLTLSDGTKVFLNAASSIRFPVIFAEDKRPVEITGEAYFEVAKNGKPFIVHTGGATIEVLGTHFDVNSYKDEAGVNTTLLEGSVKVSMLNTSLLLVPGQQAQIQKDGLIALNKNADTEAAISWTQGYFHFDDASLETVLRQLSRWYDVDVLYEKHYPGETFGGDIQKSLSLAQVLKILEKSQVKFRINGKQLIVVN